MGLMSEIRAFPVPKNAIGIWWFGQNGFIFKSHEGTLVSTDLYLTNSCADFYRDVGVNLDRRVPVLLPPEEVEVDLYTCTHNHQDHTDPETIRRLRHKDTAQFVGPQPSCAVFRKEGVEADRVVPAWPDFSMELRDVTVHGTFALPTDDTDLNHMGYVFRFGNGPAVYVTGDTDYSELLFAAAKHKPDLAITCINGGFNNLSHYEAAVVMSHIKPQAAIPCHYDMFPDNHADPLLFRASLRLRAQGVGYLQPEHGKVVVFGK